MLPRADQRRQHGDRSCGCAAVVRALHAIVQANDGRRRGGVVMREAFNILDGNAGERRNPIRRIFGDPLAQLIEAAGPSRDVILVVEPVAHNDVHHAQRQRRIGAGIDGDVPVRGARRARRIRIDDDQLCAVAASLFDEGPQMNIVAVDVRGPRDDELCVREGFRVGAEFAAINRDQRLPPVSEQIVRSSCDAPSLMEEPSVHRPVIQNANRPRIGVRQDRFRPMLFCDPLQPRSDGVESFVPRDALEGFSLAPLRQGSFWHARTPAHGIKQPIR